MLNLNWMGCGCSLTSFSFEALLRKCFVSEASGLLFEADLSAPCLFADVREASSLKDESVHVSD